MITLDNNYKAEIFTNAIVFYSANKKIAVVRDFRSTGHGWVTMELVNGYSQLEIESVARHVSNMTEYKKIIDSLK